MTTKNTQFTVHPALGGLDVASDPTVLDPNFLTNADNVEYREGGQRKKRPGFRAYSTNSTDPAASVPMVTSSSAVRALKDFWKYGNSLTPDQKYVAVTGASIFASTGDGLWHAVTTASSFGSNANRVTGITLAGDYAVMADGVSQPVAYDGLALTSTTLTTPVNIPSTATITTAFQSTSAIVVTTTGGFSFTSTVVTASSLATVSLQSTAAMTVTSTSALTSTSTGTGATQTSTSSLVVSALSTIVGVLPIAIGSTSTTPLTSTTPVTLTVTSTVQFLSLTGISSLSSVAITYTSTNPFSDWKVFTGSVYHLNRLWMHGFSTAPSLLAYTAANNIFDSTGGDTGSFTVNAGDGDRVMGVSEPFYGSLYIFKGPQKGSVYQLSGATPSSFALAQVSHGAPLLNPKGLVTTPTDIYWLSQYGVHSLETTVKFGNVEEAFLSLPIQSLWRNRVLKRTVLGNAWGFWHPQRNIVGWCVTPEGELTQHWLLCYNYALSDPKPGGKKFWSIWKTSNFGMASGEVMLVGGLDPNHSGDPHLYVGGEATGLVYEGDQEAGLNDDGSAYTAKITTPTITRFKGKMDVPETQEKGFVGVVTYFAPHGSVSANLSITVDRRVQSTTISLTGGGDTLT